MFKKNSVNEIVFKLQLNSENTKIPMAQLGNEETVLQIHYAIADPKVDE